MKRFSEETVRQAIRDIEDEAYEKFGRDVEIIVDGYNVITDDPVYAKVNWAATGSQKPEDAEAFANKILEAVKMAEAFQYNGAVLRAEGDDEDGYVFWYEMEDEQEEASEDEEQSHDDGMPIIPDDGPKDFWDMIMERQKADMEAFEQMKRERALRDMTRDMKGYETGMTAEDIAVRWPE